LIQSSGAGRIEQLRVSAAGVNDFEREEHFDNRPCMGEIEGEYCKIRTHCARYWALTARAQEYVRPIRNGFGECDKRAWLIDDVGLRERFKIDNFMTTHVDWIGIMEMSRERQENVDGS
jgi:hypothetical protein